jgi:enterochelin esterase-like enzyme
LPGVGSVQQVTIPADPALDVPALPAVVYLPPGYGTSQRRYPVVYLIHGHPGRAVDWFDGGEAAQTMTTLLADHLIQPMIVVSPTAAFSFTSDSECLNAVAGPQFETYLTRDVVGFVDRHYRTVPQAGGRAIGGMSSGGYCALNLGLRHQDEFSMILAHEPYGTPGASARWRVLGGSQALYRANSPIAYLPTMVFRHRLAVFLDAPANDQGSLSDTLWIAHELVARDQLVSLRVARGVGHTWLEARLELPYSLVFASQQLSAGGAQPI